MSVQGRGFYKGEQFSFDLPEGWNLLAMAEPKDVPGLPDVGARVRELLANVVKHASANTVLVRIDRVDDRLRIVAGHMMAPFSRHMTYGGAVLHGLDRQRNVAGQRHCALTGGQAPAKQPVSDGGPAGPGGLQNGFDLEDEVQRSSDRGVAAGFDGDAARCQ